MKSNYFTSLKEINRRNPNRFLAFYSLLRLLTKPSYPDVLPQFAGKNWPLDDVNNCIGTGSDYWRTMKKNFGDIMKTFKNSNNKRGLELEI